MKPPSLIKKIQYINDVKQSNPEKDLPGSPSDLNTGNGTEGTMVCTSLGSLVQVSDCRFRSPPILSGRHNRAKMKTETLHLFFWNIKGIS